MKTIFLALTVLTLKAFGKHLLLETFGKMFLCSFQVLSTFYFLDSKGDGEGKYTEHGEEYSEPSAYTPAPYGPSITYSWGGWS